MIKRRYIKSVWLRKWSLTNNIKNCIDKRVQRQSTQGAMKHEKLTENKA